MGKCLLTNPATKRSKVKNILEQTRAGCLTGHLVNEVPSNVCTVTHMADRVPEAVGLSLTVELLVGNGHTGSVEQHPPASGPLPCLVVSLPLLPGSLLVSLLSLSLPLLGFLVCPQGFNMGPSAFRTTCPKMLCCCSPWGGSKVGSSPDPPRSLCAV